VPKKRPGAKDRAFAVVQQHDAFQEAATLGRLSGGMKTENSVWPARWSIRPKVLFLDEPTNGVDPVSRRDFWRILYQLLAGEKRDHLRFDCVISTRG